MARASAGAFCIATLLVGAWGQPVAAASGHASGNFTAEYLACDEPAGVDLVPIDLVIDLVPQDCIVIEPVSATLLRSTES